MLVDVRRYAAPELDALHETVDVRTDCIRVSVFQSRNVSSDYGLLERASPFVHRLTRPQIVVLLEGEGRMEEGSRRCFLRAGELVVSHPFHRGTEAYSGAPCMWITLSWDPAILGSASSQAYAVTSIDERDRRRLREVALRLNGGEPAEVIAEMLTILRSIGVPFERASARELAGHVTNQDFVRLRSAVANSLERLDKHPSVDDVAAQLRWNVRSVNRRFTAMAEEYELPWKHWREALHQTRLVHAMRLLSAPCATTELVARLAGFRAPTGLCHAFAKAGLPSPQTLARAARRDVLDGWSQFV